MKYFSGILFIARIILIIFLMFTVFSGLSELYPELNNRLISLALAIWLWVDGRIEMIRK